MFDVETLKFVQVNEGARRNLGYSMDELRELTPLDLKPELDAGSFEQLIARLKSGEQQAATFVTSHRRKDGSLYPVEVRLQLSARERPVLFVALIQDITERKRAEEALRESEARFRDLAELSSDWYWEQDEDFRFVDTVDSPTGTSPLRAGSYVGKTRWQVHAERLTPEQWAAHRRQLEAHETFRDLEFQRPSLDGLMRWVSVSGQPMFDADGRFRGYRGIGRDITERKRAEEALRLRDRALESSVNAIMITDATRPDNPITYVNPAFERTTGYTAAEALGRNPRFLLGTDTQQSASETLRAAQREQREASALLRNYRKDGTLFWNELRIAPVRDATGRVTHFVGVQNDVTERVGYQAELERQANFDSLTGLANRNLLNDRLRRTIVRAERAGRLGAVLFLDLDRFKVINDSLGHVMGDRLLAEIGARLAQSVRGDDTVARTGGDEFVILLTDVAHEHDMRSSRKSCSAPSPNRCASRGASS
jgi:PAS domain S-box-containing protein